MGIDRGGTLPPVVLTGFEAEPPTPSEDISTMPESEKVAPASTRKGNSPPTLVAKENTKRLMKMLHQKNSRE